MLYGPDDKPIEESNDPLTPKWFRRWQEEQIREMYHSPLLGLLDVPTLYGPNGEILDWSKPVEWNGEAGDPERWRVQMEMDFDHRDHG